MTEYNLSANLDYVNRTISANLVGIGTGLTSLGSVSFKLYDPKGAISSMFRMSQVTAHQHMTNYAGDGNFGIDFGISPTAMAGGYDTSVYRTDLSGVYLAEPFTNWEMSSSTETIGAIIASSIIRNYELVTPNIDSFVLDKRNNQYIDYPLVIYNGDAVVQGTISSVTNKNQIVLTTANALASYTGYNLNNSFVQVLSGANSGTVFSVTNHIPGSTSIYVDRDCTSMSGQLVKVMPYRTVTSYSGWNYSSAGTNRGSGGIVARMGVDQNIPCKVGSLLYTGAYYSGMRDCSPPHVGGIDDAGTFIYSGAVVVMPSDPYRRDLVVGDLVFYNPATNLSSTVTGLVIDTRAHNNPAQGATAVTIWPPVAPHASSAYTVYRHNFVKLLSFPKLESTLLCSASKVVGVTESLGTVVSSLTGIPQYFGTVMTPSVDVEFTANEYESTFANITATSNFHIGPVHLSNGQILDDTVTMTGNTLPYLYFSGTVLNGDPITPSTVVTARGFSTQNPNVAHLYTGLYYANGVMTIAADTNFNASETVICKAEIKYGSNRINRVFTIPVQPAI